MGKSAKSLLFICVIAICAVFAAVCIVFAFKGTPKNIISTIQHEVTEYPLVVDDSLDSAPAIIKIDSDYSDIRLLNSEDGKVHISIWADKDRLGYITNRAEISIRERSKQQVKGKSVKSTIEISLPAEYAGTFNVKADCGDIKTEKFPQASLKCICDAGDISVDETSAATIDCDAGDISIAKLNDMIFVDSDCGNVEIDSADIKFASKIQCSYGNIEINNINDIRIKSTSSLGNIDIKKSNPNSDIVLTLETDYGNISVK
jgi:hypothetical protein